MDLSDPYRLIAEYFDGIFFLYEEEVGTLRYGFVDGEGLAEIGLTKEDLEGQEVAKDRPPEIKEYLHSQYRAALKGEPVEFETEAEGRHFKFQLRPVRDEAGSVIAGIGMAQDITEQVVYREELERTNERLERFTQLVFHDIRNPLNVAQGRVDMLKQKIESDHLDPIAKALDRIETLTSQDAMSPGQLDAKSLENLNLHEVVEAAWRNVATRSGCLRIETDQTIQANPNELRRLFENLFRNAVDHGGENVTVTVGDLSEGFYVEDTGPGVPSEIRERVFERGVSGSDQGTGLGLFIVKNVVDAHGWEISLAESDAGGARFEINGVGTG
jgi:PAS domain S-box-containing protein